MSEENVFGYQRFAEAFNLGLDEFMACHAEDVVHVTAPEWPEAGTYHGRDAVRKLWASIFAAGEHEIELVDVTSLDDGRLLSEMRLHVHGSASGAETTTTVYTVGTMRDGLIARIEYYIDRSTAREAARLPG